MKTAVTVLIAIVLVLITVLGVYAVTGSIVGDGGQQATEASGEFIQNLNCAILGGSQSECAGDLFGGSDDDDDGG